MWLPEGGLNGSHIKREIKKFEVAKFAQKKLLINGHVFGLCLCVLSRNSYGLFFFPGEITLGWSLTEIVIVV